MKCLDVSVWPGNLSVVADGGFSYGLNYRPECMFYFARLCPMCP